MQVPVTDDQLKAFVTDADELRLVAYRSALAQAGFEVVGWSTNPVDMLNQLPYARPHIVVCGFGFFGMQPLEIVEATRQTADQPEVVVVADDLAIRDHALDAGAFGIGPAGDAEALDRLLAELAEFLRTGERRTSGDRRGIPDRRHHQDWSKVTTERRRNDRRSGDRRDG